MVSAIVGIDGPVLEIGLGNGRSYDHLRARLVGSRTILAFDFALAAHPACVPPADCLILGDMRETLPALPARGAAPALEELNTLPGVTGSRYYAYRRR